MAKGIKMVIYTNPDIEISRDMSITDINKFISLLFTNNDISTESIETLKETLNSSCIDAGLQFYNNSVNIGWCGMDTLLYNVYPEVKYALDNMNESIQFSPEIGCYIKNSNIRIVSFDFIEHYSEVYNKSYFSDDTIDYDDMLNKMIEIYDEEYIEYTRDEFKSYLNNVIDTYENFINNTLRNRLVELSPKYGNELTDLIYKKSNWKELKT